MECTECGTTMTPIKSAVVLSNRPRRVDTSGQGDVELTYLCPNPSCPSNDDVLAQMVPTQEDIGDSAGPP